MSCAVYLMKMIYGEVMWIARYCYGFTISYAIQRMHLPVYVSKFLQVYLFLVSNMSFYSARQTMHQVVVRVWQFISLEQGDCHVRRSFRVMLHIDWFRYRRKSFVATVISCLSSFQNDKRHYERPMNLPFHKYKWETILTTHGHFCVNRSPNLRSFRWTVAISFYGRRRRLLFLFFFILGQEKVR